MEKKRVIPVWLSVVFIVLVVASCVLSFMNLTTQDSGASSIHYVLMVVLDFCAVYYCAGGFTKSSAIFFKLYCYLNIILIVFNLFVDAMSFTPCVLDFCLFLAPLVELVLFGIFAVVPDLGKKKSFRLLKILCAFLVAESVLWAILDTAWILNGVSCVILTGVFSLMVYAKYKDKEHRGTK